MKKIYIIIFIISIIFFSTSVVYATTYLYNSSEVSYDKSKSTLTKEDVQEAIDELYTKCSSPQTKCPEGYNCTLNFKVGDYVRMIPNPGTLDSEGKYATNTSYTGGSTTYYIYPKELTLWRVIRKNSDGTIDMVSQYASSTTITFVGTKGYANFVGGLNILANQYQNPTYTQSARHMGYNGQTEFISDTSYFNGISLKVFSEWPASTTTSTSLSDEKYGRGDTMYQTDVDLVNAAMGTLVALKCNDTTCSNPTNSADYWVASRYYGYSSAQVSFYGRFSSNNKVIIGTQSPFRKKVGNNAGSWRDNGFGVRIRPIVTLKSWILPTNISGSGTSTDPYVLN